MIRKKANNFKEITRAIKKDKRYKEYKEVFINPSTRFFITYYLAFYKSFLDKTATTELEFEFMKIFHNDETLKNLGSFSKKLELMIKGTSFGEIKPLLEYFYFVFKTSRYHYDKKHNIKNIFVNSDYIKLNSEKRDYYYKWIKAIQASDIEFNKIILYIKRKGI